MPHRAIVFNLFLPHPQPNVNLEFSAPTMPFIRIGAIATIHPKTSNISFWSCLLCTLSLTLPPSSLKCLQKSNPGIHIKCFRCFRCFISILDQKTARFWSKSEQNRCFKCFKRSASLLPSFQGGAGGRLFPPHQARSATNPHLQSHK